MVADSVFVVRTVSCSFTSFGMMLCFVPPWIEPTVTTHGSSGFTSRLTIVCRSRMIRAASTIGSIGQVRGRAVPALALHDDVDVSDVASASPSV